jgi:hypothetical protein
LILYSNPSVGGERYVVMLLAPRPGALRAQPAIVFGFTLS